MEGRKKKKMKKKTGKGRWKNGSRDIWCGGGGGYMHIVLNYWNGDARSCSNYRSCFVYLGWMTSYQDLSRGWFLLAEEQHFDVFVPRGSISKWIKEKIGMDIGFSCFVVSFYWIHHSKVSTTYFNNFINNI